MHALVQGLPKVKARADRMAGVTEAPGQGYELAVVSRQDKEHEERATTDIILDDDVAGGIGAGAPGRACRLPTNEVCRAHSLSCVRYIP